ncbi:RICIN domain-containing protein [Streptomyces sp. NPDC021608]|uniref:RICIN domain-containing protein n=1 Tax=Streptomyces sp. NPDC021608 TaxID=3154903 RepID=UPI0033E7512C
MIDARLDQNGTDMASGGGTTVLTGAFPRVAASGAAAFDDGTSKFLAHHYYDGDNSGQETLDIRQVTFAGGWPSRQQQQVPPDLRRLDGRRGGGHPVDVHRRPRQLWTRTAVIGGYVTFTNVRSDKCLEVAGASTANGAALDQATSATGDNQQGMVV